MSQFVLNAKEHGVNKNGSLHWKSTHFCKYIDQFSDEELKEIIIPHVTKNSSSHLFNAGVKSAKVRGANYKFKPDPNAPSSMPMNVVATSTTSYVDNENDADKISLSLNYHEVKRDIIGKDEESGSWIYKIEEKDLVETDLVGLLRTMDRICKFIFNSLSDADRKLLAMKGTNITTLNSYNPKSYPTMSCCGFNTTVRHPTNTAQHVFATKIYMIGTKGTYIEEPEDIIEMMSDPSRKITIGSTIKLFIRINGVHTHSKGNNIKKTVSILGYEKPAVATALESDDDELDDVHDPNDLEGRESDTEL